MHLRQLLIAEDNPDDVFILKMALKKATLPYAIQFAQDGCHAVEWLKGEGIYEDRKQYPIPDVLITDLKMPKKDGFELIQWIRTQPQYSKLPVIVLSSSDETRDVTRAYRLGATTYFRKSLSFQDLVHFLRTLTLPQT